MKYFMSLVCFILIACSSNHSNEKFMKDDLNADNWIQRFESNEREVYKFEKEWFENYEGMNCVKCFLDMCNNLDSKTGWVGGYLMGLILTLKSI